MLEKYDTIKGTVVSFRGGCSTVISDDGTTLKCRAILPVGTQGLFTITGYNITTDDTVYFAALDAALYDAA